MSSKKCYVFISLELETRFYREEFKYAGSMSDDQIAALTDLLDRYDLKIYDIVKLQKYVPKKEDLEK